MEILLDDGFSFGLGAFETIAVEHGTPIFLEQHLQRLRTAAVFLQIDFSAAGITQQTVHDYLENQQDDLSHCALKVVLTPRNTLFRLRKNPYTQQSYQHGFSVDISSVRRNDTSPLIKYKTLNYGDCIIEKRAAAAAGKQERIFLNTKGQICEGTVSNMTQTLQTVPLRLPGGDRTASVSPEPSSDVRELSFENRGRETVMLRPRKDLELLWPADAFGWNLFRCYLELVGILALVVSFGLFLSVSLSRPVALFVAMVTLAVGEMSPSVIERNPNEMGAGTVDRIGLVMTRLAAEITRPVSVLEPISRLSADTCVEWREVVRVVLFDLLLLPVLFALLSGWVLPRKTS